MKITFDTKDMTYQEIANKLGYSEQYVCKFLNKNNIPYKKAGRGGIRKRAGIKKHPKTERILELYFKGLKMNLIAERLNIGISTVSKIIKRNKNHDS